MNADTTATEDTPLVIVCPALKRHGRVMQYFGQRSVEEEALQCLLNNGSQKVPANSCLAKKLSLPLALDFCLPISNGSDLCKSKDESLTPRFLRLTEHIPTTSKESKEVGTQTLCEVGTQTVETMEPNPWMTGDLPQMEEFTPSNLSNACTDLDSEDSCNRLNWADAQEQAELRQEIKEAKEKLRRRTRHTKSIVVSKSSSNSHRRHHC